MSIASVVTRGFNQAVAELATRGYTIGPDIHWLADTGKSNAWAEDSSLAAGFSPESGVSNNWVAESAP